MRQIIASLFGTNCKCRRPDGQDSPVASGVLPKANVECWQSSAGTQSSSFGCDHLNDRVKHDNIKILEK